MSSHPFSSLGLTATEERLLRSLDTPEKVQTFVSAIPHNFEEEGDSCMSVREVLRSDRAHCIEAALVAALALSVHGEPPLLMDLSANDRDDDHVIALFKHNGYWGAISKGNHAYLRYRDPIYRTLRELALSYFHEYYNAKGEKTLRAYSRPLSLRAFSADDWVSGKDAWVIAEALCKVRHYPLLPRSFHGDPRPIDPVEMRTLAITEHERPTVKRKTKNTGS